MFFNWVADRQQKNLNWSVYLKPVSGGFRPIVEKMIYASYFTGGLRVASLDAENDGRAESVTAAGPGGGADVRIYKYVGEGNVVQPSGTRGGFLATPNPEDRSGFFIAGPSL